jgi:hypothetical protein
VHTQTVATTLVARTVHRSQLEDLPQLVSAVIRQTRRGAPAIFPFTTTPEIDTEGPAPTEKSMRAKAGTTKTEGLFSRPLVNK